MLRSMTLAGAVIAALFVDTSLGLPEEGGSDCELAQRYYGLAQDRLGAVNQDDAAAYLQRAADACPRYAYAQELGEVKAKSAEAADKRDAVDAFVTAYGLASSATERARSLWKYAELLNDEGDPQNAYPLILEAKSLDGSKKDIVALAAEIQPQIESPSREQLVRGLAESLYKPIIVTAAVSAGQVPSGGSSAESPAGARVATAADSGARAASERPSINLPIHFEFNSARADARTAQNIKKLAEALADKRLAGSGFAFVGHADVRGEADYNLVLSRKRADAIYDAVVELEPDLAGRISVTGKGAAEPIDSDSTEEAHWRNRRLQVLVE
ncbi:MAG TPA: OmpA family protein [Gammaproteobacteria bacterium]|nr:OmpA family protein [Gammaproteobacteria bacterium]